MFTHSFLVSVGGRLHGVASLGMAPGGRDPQFFLILKGLLGIKFQLRVKINDMDLNIFCKNILLYFQLLTEKDMYFNS